jgi:uncharacterized repeat protein (TIGR01451 family)
MLNKDDVRFYEPNQLELQVTKYITDIAYESNGMYTLHLKNYGKSTISNIVLNELFPKNIRAKLHTMKTSDN